MISTQFRDRIVTRLHEDLVGPLSELEVLSDRPSQRYSTGILYPRGTRIDAAENADGGQAVNEADDRSTGVDDDAVSLHTTYKPTVAGLSFAVQPINRAVATTIDIGITCARYVRFAVDDDGNEVVGESADRRNERWRRAPVSASVTTPLDKGEIRLDLGMHGIEGAELYLLVTSRGSLLTVTAAVANQNVRGQNSAFDEGQHLFQVAIRLSNVGNGKFSPRPSRRAETDDDSRTASLIYRETKEYVVGHTCSAHAELKSGEVAALTSTWIPVSVVKGVSDRGAPEFRRLLSSSNESGLDAAWLSGAKPDQLQDALMGLVEAYDDWIVGESRRVTDLDASLRPQAAKHVERCRQGSNRMKSAIALLKRDDRARMAFQFAQEAMNLQFSWTHGAARLIWRPFQLAFQLLVLESVANSSHSDREVMDLLWFPTGGGKTEAYLGLTAFTILLRRLQATESNDGCGVSVLMRYTLRLLTVQQFQRAASMILACELIRKRENDRQKSFVNLGGAPIGIGLWVGAAATPLTLKDAVERRDGDSSTPKQILKCPCCGSDLNWRISSRESVVECSASTDKCILASQVGRFPVWTIDEEIYRHSPSLLIATVDKFAQLVRKIETGLLFGLGTPRSGPDLIIQDELHLISGPLGSIVGLYEVAIDELCSRSGIRPKIIGSTATIRRAEEQIRALYDRSTYQFPSPGLDAGSSGFAVTDADSPGRMHIGVTTAGRSATYMLQAIAATLMQAANEQGLPDSERDHYWTLVSYFNSLRELGRALVLMQDDVPVSIAQIAARRDEPKRQVDAPAELTSRVRSHEIRDMLERLGLPHSSGEAVDLLVASNMISVGMDIPRLGLMLVNAQPKTMSEYIQATSRVGRGGVPGLVVTMYNNTRARDRSHYESFETWHRSLYRDVEASSVTPFASRAQDKALHAVLVALVRHLVPGMGKSPSLNSLKRSQVESVASVIEVRAARVDPAERAVVSQKLVRLIDEWEQRTDLQSYWDDYGRKVSLLMSAEQYAAFADLEADDDHEGLRRALWPTPNSMREVEPGSPFILRYAIKTEDT